MPEPIQVASADQPQRAPLELTWFLSALFLSRLLLLLVVYRLTGGHEISNDRGMLMDMLRSPLGILTARIHRQQHPPLLPVMEAIVGYPLSLVCSDFFTLRLTMIVWEVLLGLLFCFYLDALAVHGRRRSLCLWAFLLLPTGWLTTAVMAEDDAIAACGYLLPVYLWITGRQIWAVFASGFGLLAAKIFVALELVGLLPLITARKRKQAALAGFGPVILIYGGMAVTSLLHHTPLPLLSFKPDPYFGTNFWLILQRYSRVNLSAIGTYTGFLALAASLIPLALLLRVSRTRYTAQAVSLAFGTMLLLFFSFFYHVEPEYYAIVLPFLIATAQDAGDVVSYTLVAFLPWLGKFFQNAAFMVNASVNSGKAVPSRIFQQVFHSSPEIWLTADQAVFSVLTVYVSWRWCVKLARLRENVPN